MLDIIFYILLKIIRIIIYLIIFGIVVYLLLPWIFRKFVSPKFNAAYVYKKSDFKEKKERELIPEQINIPTITINKENGLFTVNFGENRQLIEGMVKIHYNNAIYTNKKTLGKKFKKLVIRDFSEKDDADSLGAYNVYIIKYQLENTENHLITKIKRYQDKNFIIFELEFPNGLSEVATGNYGDLATSFPSFLNESPNKQVLTFRHAVFCPPERKLKPTSSPVILYDDELNTIVISPMAEFLNSAIAKSKDGMINCGFQGEIKTIPEGTKQTFIIMFNKGINKSFNDLGQLLRKFYNAKVKDRYCSIAVSHLSYWTDNGAYYYYNTEKNMTYEDTMVEVKDYFEKKGIPIKSYNFDSWWYQKYQSPFKKILSKMFKPLYRILGGGLFGNTLRWETDPEHFSTDLETYYKERFKYPIIAHSRRWDARSPYLEKYNFITYKNQAVPIVKEFWDWLMSYANRSGIAVYEQDWLKTQVDSVPYLREEFYAQEQWLHNMATSAKENNVDVFYCMQTPGMLLYSMLHDNIVMARCSGDYNHRWPLTYRFIHCTQSCLLFNAIGINPHQDVFRSSYERMGEHYPELKCLVANLTAGVVGPGDKKERLNWQLLRHTCRNDGLLLKPDRALTANDLMFKKHSKYYISDTFTKRGNDIWRYILIVNVWPKNVKEYYFKAEELGFKEEEFILYDFYTKIPYKMNRNDRIDVGILNKYEHRYYIICPIMQNGMALIGCPEKFITCSDKQFPSVSSDNNSLKLTIEDVLNAETEVIIYSEKKPKSVKLEGGNELAYGNGKDSWYYLAGTYKVVIKLSFDDTTQKNIIIEK
ncbi:MAG: hypothetical protein ACTSPW_09825 [Promethearchaeota archaeon]